MCWQPSQTYSWRVVRCYARHDWGSGVPIWGKNGPKWAELSIQKDEIKLVDAQSTRK